ncbi:MAG: isopropylmalate isomerase, partial [Myxococcota bacterium]
RVLFRSDPGQGVSVDVAARTVEYRGGSLPARIPDGTCELLVEGTWNATSVLLGAGDAIEACARSLPYVNDFA